MKKASIIGIVIIMLALIAYNHIYKQHRNISEEPSEFQLTTSQLVDEFKKNAAKAEQIYLNKTIEISGTISHMDQKSITLDQNTFCLFDKTHNINNLQQNGITIKGRCIGYDDLLEEIKLDQCIIIN